MNLLKTVGVTRNVTRGVSARHFSLSTPHFAPNDDLQRVAEQRERAQQKDSNRKSELRKMARKRAAAKSNPERSPFYQDIATALRYIRASEVGRSPEEATISIKTDVVSAKGAAKLSGSVLFPKAIKRSRVLVFTSSQEQADQIKDKVDLVGGVELIEKIKAGEIELEFDRSFATPDIVPQLNQIARTLGPRGLMPSAKKGTVSESVSELIDEVSGTLPFREKRDNISITVGRVDFSDDEVIKNVQIAKMAFENSISQQKSKKPSLLGHTVISSTHGPGLVIKI
jgi:ribosomal protein uL1